MHDSEISPSLKEPNAVTKYGFLIVLEVEVRPLEPHCLDVHKFLQGRRIRSQYLPRKRWIRQHFHCMDLLARRVSRLGVKLIQLLL